MMRLLIGLPFLLLAAAQDHVAKTEPLSPEEEQKKFHLPKGFRIELVAAEPDIQKPLNITFDDKGRLLVTTTIEYPFPAKGKGRDRLTRMEDTDGDGKYDRITHLADDLNIPIGVMADGDEIILHSIPKLWRMSATGQRKELYGDFQNVDTHGMVNHLTRGLDGWVYACHGFSNVSKIGEVTLKSGNTFRFRDDGSRLEVYTHGQTNPFGLCWDPYDNLYTSDCHSMPAYLLLRGAYYPRFPDNPDDGLGQAPKMINHLHGSTGIAGIVWYDAGQFPEEYRGTLFIGNPVTARVNFDHLQRKGSYFQAIEKADFIRCDDPWFRPVDVQLGPDGCLYIADFYNRIIGHYEVPLTHPGRDRSRGRIWRVVYEGNPLQKMPDLTRATNDALFDLLKFDNLTVRMKAVEQLVRRKAAVKPEGHPNQRALAIWVLERQSALTDEWVEKLASDPEAVVRVHLIKAISERAQAPLALFRRALQDEDAFVRRAAAEALGLHPDAGNIEPLLAAWTDKADSHLVHSIRIALRNQLLRPGAYAGLSGEKICDVSLGVPTSEAAEFLLANRPGALHHIARYIKPELLPKVFERIDSIAALRQVNQAMVERAVKLPDSFTARGVEMARQALAGEDTKVIEEGIRLIVEMKLPGLDEELGKIARGRPRTGRLRAPAIEALRSVPILSSLAADSEFLMSLRQKAVTSLGAVNTAESRQELVKLLKDAPDKLAATIAQALTVSKEGGDLLLKTIESGKASRRLLADRSVQGRLQAFGFELKDVPEANAAVDKLIETRRKAYLGFDPDVARGQKQFEKTCAVCHQIGGKGAKVGPSLDGIGHRGLERVLEDVLDPSRAVDQAFRSTIVRTKSGQVYSGLIVREDGEALVIVESGEEVRVPLADVEKRTVSSLSPMPPNLADTMSEEDFLHLIGYLLSQK